VFVTPYAKFPTYNFLATLGLLEKKSRNTTKSLCVNQLHGKNRPFFSLGNKMMRIPQQNPRPTTFPQGILMLVPKPRYSHQQKIKQRFRQCSKPTVRTRYLIIFNLWNGRTARETAEALAIHNTTVYRVARNFRTHGECGLWDGREDNGQDKLDDDFLGLLDQVVRSNPQEHGWRRPTWTRELLVETMVRKTGVRIHVTTMSRALARIKARRGKPRPRVKCPWYPGVKTRRLNQIARLVETLPRKEVAVYEDEVDVHLNPKIGLDWMGKGQQKDAITRFNARIYDWSRRELKVSYHLLISLPGGIGYGSSIAKGRGLDGGVSGCRRSMVRQVWTPNAHLLLSPPSYLHVRWATGLGLQVGALPGPSLSESRMHVQSRKRVGFDHATMAHWLGRFLLAGSSPLFASLVSSSTSR
jgi:transposase